MVTERIAQGGQVGQRSRVSRDGSDEWQTMNLDLHIARLVLDGLDIAPGQRHLLQASVTTELTRLLNNDGLAPSLVEGVVLPRLSTNDIRLTSNNPTQLGQQIAQSMYRDIGHE
jgi:hypothetical protein